MTPAEELLNKAQNALDSGDHTNAKTYVEQALKKAEEIKNQYEKAKNAIAQAEGFLSPIGSAKKAFEKGDYVKAYRLAVEAGKKKVLYQRLFALGVVIALAVVSGSAYTIRRRKERERKLKRFNKLLTKAEKAPSYEKVEILREAYNLIGGVEPSLAQKAKNLLDSAEKETAKILESLIKEFNDAIENLDVKTAEEKLGEAEPYAKAMNKSLEQYRAKLGDVKSALTTLQEAETLFSEGELSLTYSPVEAVKMAKKAVKIAGDIEGIRLRAQELFSRAERELSRTLSKGDSLLSEKKFDEAIQTYGSALPLAGPSERPNSSGKR